MLADIVDHVIGIDPDRDRITASLVEASTGGELATEAFETTRGGYERLVAWADRHTSRESRAWAVEGSGSYGSGACAHLGAAREQVIEFSHPRTAATSDGAKTDALDARRAAREVLGRSRPGRPARPGPPRGAASAGIHPPRRPDGAHRGDQRTQSPHHQRARGPARPAPRPHHRRPSRQMRRVPSAGGPPQRDHSHQTGPAQPRAADQDPHRRGRRAANEHPRARRSRRPPPAQPARRRTRHRRATLHRLVTPRPLPQRSSLRPPRGRRPTRSVLRGKTPATASTAAATANSTAHCTPSPSPAAATAPTPRPTSPNEPPKAKPPEKPNAASNATSPARSTASSNTPKSTLDKHRSIVYAKALFARALSSFLSPISASNSDAGHCPLRAHCVLCYGLATQALRGNPAQGPDIGIAIA